MDWEELRKQEVGTILHDEFKDGARFIVMRGPASLCAYVGVPIEHPLAGHGYDDLPVDAHGGLTFSKGGGGNWPEGFYWYGWDYAHCDDYCFYYDEPPLMSSSIRNRGKKWLVEDVINDSWCAIYDFKRLIKLAEQIASK